MAATIKDIVRESGISLTTVSKYLNGKQVRKSSEEKIEAAIKALDYHVNLNARSLRTSKSMTVGVLVDDIRNVFYCNMIHRLSQELEKNNYSVIISETRDLTEEFDVKMEALIRRDVDGIVIITTQIKAEQLEKFCATFSNIVVIDAVLGGLNCDFVVTDNIAAAYCATEQLITAGHCRIATTRAPQNWFTAQERLLGYKRALTDYKIEIDESLIFDTGFDIQSGYDFMKWLADRINEPNGPTAILIQSYLITTGFITALAEERIPLLKDLSAICIDYYDINVAYSPKLDSYKQQDDELAHSAVRLLLESMSGKKQERRIVRIPAKYIPGQTVRRAKENR